MSYQTKRKIMNGAVYAALALVIAAIIFITIITFTSSNKPIEPSKTPTPLPYKTQTILPDPKPTQNTSESADASAEPTVAPEDTSTPDPTKTKLPVDNNVEPTYTLPSEGYIMKDHCTDVPVFSFTMNDYRTHSGIDISAPVGSSVCAIAKGTIIDVYDDPLFGKTVCIDHGDNLISIYSNLDSELASGIAIGVKVGEGQVIGAIGNTAIIECAESDHLHFEINHGGECKNPATYLEFPTSEDKIDIPGNE